MSSKSTGMNLINEKIENIKKGIFSRKDAADSDFSNLENVERLRKKFKDNMYITKEDYLEVIKRLEALKAELTHVESLLDDFELSGKLIEEIRQNQEENLEKISSDIQGTKDNLLNEVSTLKNYLEEKGSSDIAYEKISSDIQGTKDNLLDEISALKNYLNEKESSDIAHADNFTESLEASIEELNSSTRDSIDSISLSFDKRFDIFKEKLCNEINLKNKDFKKNFMNELEETNAKSKKTLNVLTLLIIVNSVLLISLIYFVVNLA